MGGVTLPSLRLVQKTLRNQLIYCYICSRGILVAIILKLRNFAVAVINFLQQLIEVVHLPEYIDGLGRSMVVCRMNLWRPCTMVIFIGNIDRMLQIFNYQQINALHNCTFAWLPLRRHQAIVYIRDRHIQLAMFWLGYDSIIHSHVLGLVLLLQSDAVTSLLTNSDTAFRRKNWHYEHNKAKQFAYSEGYTVLDVFSPPILIALKHYHDREVKSTIMPSSLYM